MSRVRSAELTQPVTITCPPHLPGYSTNYACTSVETPGSDFSKNDRVFNKISLMSEIRLHKFRLPPAQIVVEVFLQVVRAYFCTHARYMWCEIRIRYLHRCNVCVLCVSENCYNHMSL